MAKVFPALTAEHRRWIARQHVFFVATAPPGGDGYVNVSPKGYDTFRVLDEGTVAYLDLTGSGVETIAHLRAGASITVMFCAFEGSPRILRLYGRGSVSVPGDPGFEELASAWDDLPGRRSVISVELERVVSSCGYSIPFMSYEGEREKLLDWAGKRGPAGVARYWGEKNRESLDGLPGLAAP